MSTQHQHQRSNIKKRKWFASLCFIICISVYYSYICHLQNVLYSIRFCKIWFISWITGWNTLCWLISYFLTLML